jgi:hypothetical protein
MLFTTQHSTLGFLTLDVLVTENISLPNEVTKYPVEDGGPNISDHITRGNEEITIAGAITATESLAFEFSGMCYSKLIDTVETLRNMHAGRQPVKVVTGLGVYEDMAFTSLTINRTNGQNGGQWLEINANLRKIRKVAIKEAELPADQNQSGKGKTGQTERRTGQSGNASTTPANDQSALKTLKDNKGDIVAKAKALVGF